MYRSSSNNKYLIFNSIIYFIHSIYCSVQLDTLKEFMKRYSIIHLVILETYIAPLQDTTTQRRSQPSHGQRRRTLKGRSSARNAAQQGDHSRPMGPQPKKPFAA